MRNFHAVLIAVGLAASLLTGCGDTGLKAPVAQKEVRKAPPPPLPLAAQPAPQTKPEPEPLRKKAEPGVGAKTGGGIYPAATYFKMRETIVFQQVEHDLQLYKAEHDNKGPKTHEEFMEKIIKANNIKLPELPEGDRYRYDPKTEQLMVESPAPE
jgi:hypothetical protein